MREKLLDERLTSVVTYIKPNSKVADIGSDHGYIPLYLIKNNICTNVLVTDIKEGPLSSARKNFEKYGLEDKLMTMLYDGINPEILLNFDTVIIAGMGGSTISDILLKVKKELITNNTELIIQPMTEQEKLRKTLISIGYRIVSEKSPKTDNNKIYNVIYAIKGENEKYSRAELILGKYSLNENKENYLENLNKYIVNLQKAVDMGAKNKEGILEEFLKFREELKNGKVN